MRFDQYASHCIVSNFPLHRDSHSQISTATEIPSTSTLSGCNLIRLSFLDWPSRLVLPAASALSCHLLADHPVKLCSIIFCMLIDCLLHQFLGSIQKRVRVPHRMHVVNELKQHVVDVHLCLSAISLSMCRLIDVCKDVLNCFPDLFYVVCTYSP